MCWKIRVNWILNSFCSDWKTRGVFYTLVHFKWLFLQRGWSHDTKAYQSHNFSTLTHLSLNKDSGASGRLKCACFHNSRLSARRKTEQNPHKKSLLIYQSLLWNASHYCVYCFSAKVLLWNKANGIMKKIIADHTTLTKRNECLKSCSAKHIVGVWVYGLRCRSGEDKRLVLFWT